MEENKNLQILNNLETTTNSSDIEIDDKLLINGIENTQDLRDCLANIEQELQQIGQLTVEDCINNGDKIADLANEIEQCDGILEGMENMLVNFLGDLGKISGDMKHLKEQSIEINQQLNNHQRVRAELSQFVDDMVVPHSMIKIITEKDVNSTEFLEQLHELQHKLQFIKTQQFKDAKSVGDVRDVVENLKYKALEKIREWLLLRISLFRKPLTNYQIPQNALLKNRFFLIF
uniref:Vacuolar protein sorting-associated protein 52 homolog n=1 Tax=Meloidogyne enterolobii TaxID=390850 RepID=A0A6V7TN03_MELEN|nr:unnamed protein product [Meloidogyne enterolobii]